MTAAPGAEQAREGQTFAHRGSRLLAYVNFVKLPHTLFALPFALVGVVLASYRAPVTWRSLGWVVLAFTCARFAAMGFNRIVDREIDARNPRTRQRDCRAAYSASPSRLGVVIASALFVWAAWRTEFAVRRAVAARLGGCFSTATKRFTRWCHLVLGVGMSIAPWADISR
jgi:4-hydroxybenzoate polyprenyltransferase